MNHTAKSENFAPDPPGDDDVILLSHGAGGEETGRLVRNVFLRYLGNPVLEKSEDAAPIDLHRSGAVTADSFTVKPVFFPGGDIGKLAIAGLCNDLAVMGAKPEHLTLTFVLEEGFPLNKLHTLLHSMREELEINAAQVVAADTKVIENRGTREILISGSAWGKIQNGGCSVYRTSPRDEIIVSGPVGDHGAAIMMEQTEFSMKSGLKSDCRSLWPVIEKLLEECPPVALRDITRGGLATILNEWVTQSKLSIEIDERKIPVRPEVKGFCELLGLDPLHMACEGNFAGAFPPGRGEFAVSALRRMGFEHAAVIGSFIASSSPSNLSQVILNTGVSRRRLEPLRGEMFPRIC